MARTAFIVTVVAALAVVCSAATFDCHPNHVYVTSKASTESVERLIEQGVMRGWNSGVGFVVCPRRMELSVDFDMVNAGKLNSTEEYQLLVFQEQEDDKEAGLNTWHAALQPSRSLRLLHREKTVVVVAVALASKESIEYPFNAAIVPMMSFPMVPRPSTGSDILRAAHGKLLANGPDPLVERLVNLVTVESAKYFLDYLTGVTSAITTRNSIAPDGQVAADWIEKQFKAYGFNTTQQEFKTGYNPNVIATLPGVESDKVMIVGAHYDSRALPRESATAVAPGANDDGSGTSMLLQLAKIISESSTSFRYTLIIGAWGGEEQGLYGSRFYAQQARNNSLDIIGMIQGDMLAYRKPGEGIQCGFPAKYADQLLTDLCMSVMADYTPEVETCYTTACCSDHQSFYEQGYSSTQFFERCGSIVDPMYHNKGDIVDRTGYDLEGQLISITKAMVATAATVLEIEDGY